MKTIIINMSKTQFFILNLFLRYIAVLLTLVIGIMAINSYKTPLMEWSLYGMMLIIALFSIVLNSETFTAQMELMEKELNLEKFDEFLDAANSVIALVPFYRHAKTIYQFLKAKSLYLQGNYRESLSLLNQIQIEHVMKKFRPTMIIDILYLKLQIKLCMGETVQFSVFEEKVTQYCQNDCASEIISKGAAIYDLFFYGRPNDYFERIQANSKLEELTYSFYSGVNHSLKGNSETAIRFFKQIISYPDNLFMVREARSRLKSISES